LLWDISGPVFEHYMERGQAVNSEDILPCWKTSWNLLFAVNAVLLHHENARPHATAATIKAIQKINFELLPHPPYSWNLAPSDYHLFGSLKKALQRRRFGSDEEVKQVVHTWFCDQHFSAIELRSLLNVIKSVWMSRETMLKNDIIIMSVSHFSNNK
jgi:histone-lysine N-methyltransferase SETMAR